MQRKRIYNIGIAVIIISTLLSPLSYITIGKVEKGKVVRVTFIYYDLPILPSSSHPVIEFEYDGKTYDINGEEDQKYLVGDEVKVIFYPWKPEKAKEFSIIGLFIDTLVQLPIGLLIWWAFFKSFPKLFMTPEAPLSLYNLVYKYKQKKPDKGISDLHISIRFFIYLLIIIIVIALLNALWSIYKEMLSENLPYQVGVGIIAVILILLFTIVNKVRKG